MLLTQHMPTPNTAGRQAIMIKSNFYLSIISTALVTSVIVTVCCNASACAPLSKFRKQPFSPVFLATATATGTPSHYFGFGPFPTVFQHQHVKPDGT